jgi:hypothetical protein
MHTPMKQLFVSILGLLVLAFACKKEPGPGGKATITGTVITRYFDPYFKDFQFDHNSTETSVYLIYGNQTYYGNDVTTNYNGIFAFKYLQPGTYTIYIYSEDSTKTNPANELVIKKEVTVSKSDKAVDAGTLYRVKALKYNQGYANICGAISDPGQNVFIKYPDNTTDNTRSDEAGGYCFKNLLKGIYTVYWIKSNVTYSKKDTITDVYQNLTINL